LNNLTKTK